MKYIPITINHLQRQRHTRTLREYPAILNISRTGRVALLQLCSQSEETSLRMREQSLSREASQSAVRCRWLSLCTVWPSQVSRSASSRQCSCPFYSSGEGFLFFGKASHHPWLSAPLQPRFGSLRLPALPKAKIATKGRRSVNATVTQYISSVNGVSLPTD